MGHLMNEGLYLCNFVTSECAGLVHSPIGDCHVRWVHLEGTPMSDTAKVKAGFSEAALNVRGETLGDLRPERVTLDREPAVGVMEGRTVEHSVTEVADDTGTVTVHDLAEPSLVVGGVEA